MDYIIREMRMDDYDRVIDLWRRCEGIGLSDADQRERIAFFLQRNPGMSFVAAGEGGEIAGAVLCGTDGRRGYLHHLAVDSRWRRHGIGAALARRCLDALAALNVTRCHIFVIAKNDAGLAFWRQQGWYDRVELVLMSHNIP